jgi:CheY-like chemotaxis protein
LLIDDDVETSLKYKKWLEEGEGDFNLTLVNEPELAEQNFQPQNYDLVLIGFRMSVVDSFDLYDKLKETSKKVENNKGKGFRICFITSSVINYKALAEIHPEFGEECYVCKKVAKDVFMKHVYSLTNTVR